METHISSKGQITLPAVFRRRLGLKAGDPLTVSLTAEGKVLLEARRPTTAPDGNDGERAISIIRTTAGLLSDFPETGGDYTRRLREEDGKRWEALGLDHVGD